MRIIFFGTPEFALTVLRGLVREGLIPIAVVCNPDSPVGRKKIVTPPPTKIFANAMKPPIPVFQPNSIDRAIVDNLSSLGADVGIVASYSKILPRRLLDVTRRGIVGVHPSLLPLYRGPSPIRTAILDGVESSGVSLYRLAEGIDNGPIIAQSEVKLAGLSYLEAEPMMASAAVSLISTHLPEYVKGVLAPHPQDESRATYTRKFTRDDAFILPETLERALAGDKTAAVASYRKILAMNPEPGVWTTGFRNFGDKNLKILDASLSDSTLILKTVQVAGEKPTRL